MEGKGKGKFVEPPCLAKKQKLTPVPEQRLLTFIPEVVNRREVDIQQHLSLHENAGSSRQAIAVDMMSRMAQSLNVVGNDLWERFRTDDPLALVELGIHSKVVINTHPLNLYVLIFLVFSYFNLVLFHFSSFTLFLASSASMP